ALNESDCLSRSLWRICPVVDRGGSKTISDAFPSIRAIDPAWIYRGDQWYLVCARYRDPDLSQNRLYPVCRFTRANLLAPVRPGEFPLVFGYCADADGAGALAPEPITREHGGAVDPFAGISLEH